jgi:hypothetical protein
MRIGPHWLLLMAIGGVSIFLLGRRSVERQEPPMTSQIVYLLILARPRLQKRLLLFHTIHSAAPICGIDRPNRGA